MHDRRLERTSNGRGRVSGRTLAELDALDYGSWHPGPPDPLATAKDQWGHHPTDPSPPDAGLAGEAEGEPELDRSRLLTLDRLLRAVRDADRAVHLLIETKHPTRYGSGVERRLVALLHEHGLATPRADDPVQATIMSFSPLALRKVRALAPLLPTVLLLDVLPPGLHPGRLPFGVRIAGPSVGLVRARPALVPALQAAGNRVYAWTVNEPDEVDLVLSYGVDGIITDRPRYVLDRLGR